jgi:hypothetical protein
MLLAEDGDIQSFFFHVFLHFELTAIDVCADGVHARLAVLKTALQLHANLNTLSAWAEEAALTFDLIFNDFFDNLLMI